MAVEQAWSVRISHWEPLRLVLTGLSCLGWDVKKSYPVAMFRCHKKRYPQSFSRRGVLGHRAEIVVGTTVGDALNVEQFKYYAAQDRAQ